MTLSPSILNLSSATVADLVPARRLIVLVPPLEVDLTAVTRRVWELAQASGAYILFVGMYSDPAQEPRLRRDLVTMTAITNDGRAFSDAEVVYGKDWVAAVRSRWQPGDMVLCFEEQRIGLSHRPLDQILRSDLDLPLVILTGIYSQGNSYLNWFSQAKAWLGAIAIIAGFFVFQMKIGPTENGWATALQLLAILVETGLILAWNSLIG